MKKYLSVFFLLMFALILTFGSVSVAVAAVDEQDLNAAINDTASFLQKNVNSPTVSSIGGDWTILALARSSYSVPQSYYDGYYNRVVNYVKENKGILHDRKYTEYSRVVIALTAIGKDPSNVGGYDLLKPLGDYEKTSYQGLNGVSFALIALDCGNYDMPVNDDAKVQATRDMYVQYILNKQLADGGWSLAGTEADADVTAMALQALSNYQNDKSVKDAVTKGVNCLSNIQNNDGGFDSWGVSNCESTVQVIVALGELGISLDDQRFIKNNNSLLDNLMTFYLKGNGFKHDTGSSVTNLMATEQGLYALASAKRSLDDKNSLYDMSDVVASVPDDEGGLVGKNPDVKVMPVVSPGKTFSDIKNHTNQKAIEELAARAIINGMSDNIFAPDASMTRAEFATIMVRGLGLEAKEVAVFNDVKKGAWYSGYIGTAYSYGIVKGTSATTFSPNSTITREEAAAMVVRAAVLCGLDTELTDNQISAVLGDFKDSAKVSDWAKKYLAYCYNSGILEKAENIQPQKAILRCEIAQILYNMLNLADLI
jgi:hypothetical protein